MRLDVTLTLVILAMVFFVLIGYPALALLAGLLGILFIGASGERCQSFSGIDVPSAGDYPKFDFWKDLLKDSGEFLGKLSKTFLRTEIPVDSWSSWVKKSVYGEKGGDTSIYMYGPYAMVLPKNFPQDMHKLVMLQNYANILAVLEEKGALDPDTKKEILQKIKKILEENNK